MQAGFQTPPAIESGEDRTHSEKPNATKTARDELFRARRNAREHDKERTPLGSILSCEMKHLLIVKRGGGALTLAVSTVNFALITYKINEYLEQQRILSPHTFSIRDAAKVAFAMLVLRYLLCIFALGHSVLGFKKLTV